MTPYFFASPPALVFGNMQSLGDHSAGASSTPLSTGNIVNVVRCPARDCHRSRIHRRCPRQMCRPHCLSHGGCPFHVLDGVKAAGAIPKVTPVSVNLAQPLVADAGKSTLGISTWHSGAVRWMPPEVLKGGRCTFAGDVYSFGSVCLEARNRSTKRTPSIRHLHLVHR